MSHPSSTPPRTPLLLRPRVQQVVYPLLVLLVLLGAWQGTVDALELPAYLVPSPILMFKTLVEDAGMLMPALWVTLKITLLSFAAATVIGVLAGVFELVPMFGALLVAIPAIVIALFQPLPTALWVAVLAVLLVPWV